MIALFTRINDYQRSNGSVLRATVSIPPDVVLHLFGQPDESDGYKSSMEWLFEDEEGNVVSLYDWKSTNLYSSELPSPDVLLASPVSYEFHIGAHDYQTAQKFSDWLLVKGV